MVLSKLLGHTCPRILAKPNYILDRQKNLSLVLKRWSGHNAMEITPSDLEWKFTKNVLHFWFIIAVVPLSVFLAIINTRANPELSEIPEGYEPRHWEYYKHPITRFMARYVFNPLELDHEVKMARKEKESESAILRKIHAEVKKTMSFYNDHRSSAFIGYLGDSKRIARDVTHFKFQFQKTTENTALEEAYDANVNYVTPTEGMHVGNTDIDE